LYKTALAAISELYTVFGRVATL